MKLSKNIILTGRDIIKGEVTKTNLNTNSFLECTPWQMVELADKTPEWKEWNADYFEWIGLMQVKRNFKKIVKNRRLASGILDLEDYMVAEPGDIATLNNWSLSEETENSLNRFHPLLPPFLKVLDGEFLKRNLRIYVSCTDAATVDEKLEYKKGKVDDIVTKLMLSQKQEALQKLGISEEDPEQSEQFYSEIEATKDLAQAESKYKSYRHIFEQFGQHVLNKDYDKFRMPELEREAFMETLTNSREFWHIDLGEDDYKLEFLDSSKCFYHMSSNIKYVSNGDYFGWFEEMSTGDIINKIGKKLNEEQFQNLKQTLESYNSTLQNGGGVSLVSHEKAWPGAYYDTSKPYPLGKQNIPMVDYWQNENLRAMNTNFQHADSSSIASIFGGNSTGFDKPKMFRVMRLYWKSQRKVGWLTKKDKTGQIVFQDWIDENFIITEKPIYDKSLVLEEKKTNLVYGEHIDWEWVNEWRHIIKINNNIENSFWKNQMTYGFNPIYIDGDAVKFQFTGKKDNPYDVYPPVEGVEFKTRQVRPVSFVDLIAPSQINYNIAMNKIPDIMFQDIGLVMSYAKASMNTSNSGVEVAANEREEMLRNLRDNKIFEYNPPDKDVQMTYGNVPIKPEILNYSRIDEGLKYLNLAALIKEQASQIIGISPSRLAQSKASQTATGVQSDVNYSETQTEPYFHQHIVEFMPRVYQRMLEAAQYYCTIKESARVSYQTTNQENAFLEVENMDGLARNYNIKCTSDIKESVVKEKLQKLFLENNTTDATLLDLAQGVMSESPSEILEQLRKSQVKKEKMEQQRYEQEMKDKEAEREAAIQKQRELHEFESGENEKDRESNERIAELRALGGLQSDSDVDGVTDALANIESLRKDRQLQTVQNNFDEKLSFDKKKHEDTLGLAKDQMLNKTAIEQKKLAIALVNANSKTDKALSKKVAKSQGVTK